MKREVKSGAAALLVLCWPLSVPAKTVLTPGAKPTEIVKGRQPFTFSRPPVIRTSFSRDEPFLEGELTYGYTGRVVTEISRSGDIVAPAGSYAYGVPLHPISMVGYPMHPQMAEKEELVWCAITPNERNTNTHNEKNSKLASVCLFNKGLGFGEHDSLMTTAAVILDSDSYGGGEIVPAPLDLGAPIRVRYYIQNLGKIARLKGQIWVGDKLANEWGYIFGNIMRVSQPAERMFSVGGAVIGISPDAAAKDHYTLRVIEPLKPDGGVPLTEIRNDSGAPTQSP